MGNLRLHNSPRADKGIARPNRRASLLARFETKYTPEPNTGCWLWDGAINSSGYGHIGQGGKYAPVLQAHRVSWAMYNGPIPSDLEIDHKCRVRSCVNPRHLELVTHTENVRRGLSRSSPLVCRNGHPRTNDNTYLYKGWRHCKVCRGAATRRYLGT